ncbi:hypothetical protein [Methylobacterium iners]|uniref:Uncharacterized protein n=1 Tax=Methylobacterium iners TaxID=418707 RepID=A0ABQ4S1Q1_9HYPH|nr:hypothetical protein [Methylobacterium iners]GJD96796.1 hypothetical protein OCOJLMKI_4021 [Methylobacterium iners]
MPDDAKRSKTDEKVGYRQDGTTPSDKHRPENQQGALNEKLDEALEETFPSSDPVSVKITK